MAADKRPNIVADEKCTFCLSSVPRAKSQKRYGDLQEVNCPCCGRFRITGTMIDVLPHWDLSATQWTALAYDLKQMTSRSEPPRLDRDVLRVLKESAKLPHPDQILDDFAIWTGSQSRWPGDTINVNYSEHRTVLGAVDQNAFNYMINCMERSGYFGGDVLTTMSGVPEARYAGCSLTPKGWQRFRELSSSRAARKYGFMAMKYGDDEVDAVVRNHFAPQVALTGFDLKRLDDGQPAGLIDDQLRVRIRQARFLVCDLTHGNRGAYWEAGFAEGLGIPVIYTCRRDVFDEPNHPCHPHFDASHWVTVAWDPADPSAAATKLKATVRATLPAEARLED